jgi:hypothetical protein
MKKKVKNRAGAVGVTQSSIRRRQPNPTRKEKRGPAAAGVQRSANSSKKKRKNKIEEQNKTKKKREWNEGFVFHPCFCARNLEFGDPFGVWVPRLPRIFTLHFCAEKKRKKKKNCVPRKTKPSYYK